MYNDKIIKVEGIDSLGRDTSSGAIVSTDSEEVRRHLERRKRQLSSEERIKALEEKCASLEETIQRGFDSILQAINNKNS